MVAAAAGLGSVLAAYSDVLPSPIQQLAHVAIAAPTPQGADSQRPGSPGPGHGARLTEQPGSQPATGPHQPAAPAASSGPGNTPTPHFSPEASRSPGRGGANGGCGTSLWRTPSPSPKASAGSSLPPTMHCGGIPTGPAAQPTLNPYVP
jgi:hypothetical protein